MSTIKTVIPDVGDGKYHDEIFFSVWKDNWLRQQG